MRGEREADSHVLVLVRVSFGPAVAAAAAVSVLLKNDGVVICGDGEVLKMEKESRTIGRVRVRGNNFATPETRRLVEFSSPVQSAVAPRK